MEREPDTDNVVYIDEYPELQKRVWLRHLAAQRLGQLARFESNSAQLILFPRQGNPDGAA